MNSLKTLFFLFSFFACVLISGCTPDQTETDKSPGIQGYVEWLADDNRSGRLAGSPGEAEAANYIADRFLAAGLTPYGDDETFFQQFVLTGPMPQAMNIDNYISRNVAGLIEGRENPGQFIILGAHYDGQGSGGIISMNHNMEPELHNSADDNASGTAGLIHLAEYFSKNRPAKSILFVAFSGEEMGLLGSRYFVEQLSIETDYVQAMINMDMIGRLAEHELTIFGTGTSDKWKELFEQVSVDSLQISTVPTGSGASDHASFYEAGIPVLHYFTGTHDDYHRATDTADKINYDGMEKVLHHIREMIKMLDQTDIAEMNFTESTDRSEASVMFDGPSLGVMPDYSYTGEGFRISDVRSGEPAHTAGMQKGDIIVQIGETEINDIYDYMNALNILESGSRIDVTVIRNGELVTSEVQF